MSTELAYVPSEHSALLFGVSNLGVVHGDASALERALHYMQVGHMATDATPEVQSAMLAIAELLEVPPPQPPAAIPIAVTRLNVGNTYDCNMACTYCYNELSIKDRKGSESPGGMAPETARKMVDALFREARHEAAVSLVFIGGEPLLEKRDLMATVDYARRIALGTQQRLDVAVYTNGLGLTADIVRWGNENGVSFVVSLDGPPLINDEHRVTRGGRGTAAIVLRNIRTLMELSADPVRRVRAVATEPRRLLPLHRYLYDLGFNEIHVQAAYDEDGMGGRDQIPDLVELMSWYEGYLTNGTVLGVNPFEGILHRLLRRGEAISSWYPCTAGRSALGVTPSGDLYPCHHFLEEGSFRLGNVQDGIPSMSQRQEFFHRVDERDPCKSCWARHLCGGECYHRSHTAGHGYNGVLPAVCEERKAVIGLCLELFQRLATNHPGVLKSIAARNYTPVVPRPSAYDEQDLRAYE
jgi:uncharacterized protein